jgi:hypothetical protein
MAGNERKAAFATPRTGWIAAPHFGCRRVPAWAAPDLANAGDRAERPLVGTNWQMGRPSQLR